jgi:hypothetical protein
MELAGLEPATSWVRSRRSPKLSYSPEGLTPRMVAADPRFASLKPPRNGLHHLVQPLDEWGTGEGHPQGAQ